MKELGSRVALSCLCGGERFSSLFLYAASPEGETRFPLPSGSYRREIVRCLFCGHFLSCHEMDLEILYSGTYVDSTYGEGGIRCAFERIAALEPSRSDNGGRVRGILEYTQRHFSSSAEKRPLSVLDVGSGLCVFLHRMKEAGWEGTALDPDPRAVEHARQTVGVQAILGDFTKVRDIGRFDLITFNKVLEHVRDPVPLLSKAREHLQPGGLVYLELPDGESACADGPGREEFFIEHWHIFSAASFAVLVSRSGFSLRHLERLREPSGKYTLRGFLTCRA